MTIEQALEELKNAANELTVIGDANQALINNPEYFNNLWEKVKYYYDYITNNTENDPNAEDGFDERWLAACDIVGDIETNNPTLADWVMKIW